MGHEHKYMGHETANWGGRGLGYMLFNAHLCNQPCSCKSGGHDRCKMHTVKLRFFLDGQTYTAEAEDVPVAVAPEPLEAEAVALLPVTTYTAEAETVQPPVAQKPKQVEAGAPEKTILQWMTGMGHTDLTSAAGAVQEFGYADLAEVRADSVADIDYMLAHDGLGWNCKLQGRFKRKWEEMQI
jgi:hypothetical protein